jgi:hypothetical protein
MIREKVEAGIALQTMALSGRPCGRRCLAEGRCDNRANIVIRAGIYISLSSVIGRFRMRLPVAL